MGKKEYPWFPVYAAETLADGRFQGWNLEERGAWLTLLCFNWNDGSIPGSPSALARLLHVEASDAARIWSVIGDRFNPVPGKPDRFSSPRLESERDRAAQIAKKRSAAGREGADARWQGQKQEDGKGMRLPSSEDGNGKANVCPIQSPSPDPIHTGGTRLVSPFGKADPSPATSAVLAALFDRRIDAAAPSDKNAARVEAAIVAATVPIAVERLAAVLSDPNAKRPLTYHVDAIRGTKPPRRTHGDLGCELEPWPSLLTDDEKRQVVAEYARVHPDYDGAPVGITGASAHSAEIGMVNERWRAIAEARRTA